MDPNNADAYLCAGNANMSFEKYDIAIKYYQKAVECEPENGDRYFHLGYALATNSQSAEAIAIFAKADEIGCSPEVTGQLYKILGMLCFDLKNMMMRLLIYVKPKQLSESILKYYKEKR